MNKYTELSFKLGSMSYDELLVFAQNNCKEWLPNFESSESIRSYLLDKLWKPKMLPFDTARCMPDTPDELCKECSRWSNHPNQTWETWTPIMSVENSQSEDCKYIPYNQL